MKGGVITIPKYELKECRNGTGSFWFIDVRSLYSDSQT